VYFNIFVYFFLFTKYSAPDVSVLFMGSVVRAPQPWTR